MKYGAYQIPISNWDGKQYSDAAADANATRILGLQGLQKVYDSSFHNLSDNYATYVKNERDSADARAYSNFISLVNKNNQEIQYNQDLLTNPNTPYEQRGGIADRLRQLQENDRVLREGLLGNISVENADTYKDKLLSEPTPTRKVSLEASAEQVSKNVFAENTYNDLLYNNAELFLLNRQLNDNVVDIGNTPYQSKARINALKDAANSAETYISTVRGQLLQRNTHPTVVLQIVNNLRNYFNTRLAQLHPDAALLSSAHKAHIPLQDNTPPASSAKIQDK